MNQRNFHPDPSRQATKGENLKAALPCNDAWGMDLYTHYCVRHLCL